jgi:hypothetical protein
MYIRDIHYVKNHHSGTTNILLDSLDDALENPGVRPLSREADILKLIHTFFDVYYVKNHQDSSQEPSILRRSESSILSLIILFRVKINAAIYIEIRNGVKIFKNGFWV